MNEIRNDECNEPNYLSDKTGKKSKNILLALEYPLFIVHSVLVKPFNPGKRQARNWGWGGGWAPAFHTLA